MVLQIKHFYFLKTGFTLLFPHKFFTLTQQVRGTVIFKRLGMIRLLYAAAPKRDYNCLFPTVGQLVTNLSHFTP